MVLPVVIFLYGLLSPAICDPDNFTYADTCKPPPGFNNTDTGLTNLTYESLRPIERCCPQCDYCKDLGGSCLLKWAVELYPHCCDFSPAQPCKDYSCECCIRCADDTCSPCVQTGGECRLECRSGELEDNTNVCAYHNDGAGCKCCKRCETTSECTDAQGICVTNPNDCPQGSFASTGCCGGCYCCKPVQEVIVDGICEIKGGYCSEVADCANGFYAWYAQCSKSVFNTGLQSTVFGYCCFPKQTSSPVVPGRIESFHLNQAPLYHHQDTRRHPRKLLG